MFVSVPGIEGNISIAYGNANIGLNANAGNEI